MWVFHSIPTSQLAFKDGVAASLCGIPMNATTAAMATPPTAVHNAGLDLVIIVPSAEFVAVPAIQTCAMIRHGPPEPASYGTTPMNSWAPLRGIRDRCARFSRV
jgi:hypothetical protein